MSALESLRLGFAFGLGSATFFAPCALPLLPGYVAYFLGQDGDGAKMPDTMRNRLLRAIGVSLTTSLGILAVYAVLGAIVFALGTQLLGSIGVLELVVGVLLIVMGVYMASGKSVTSPIHIQLPERRRGVLGYFAFGVIYAAAAAGCTAFLFIGVAGIALSAGPIGGVAVLGAYAAGMAVLLSVVTIATALGRGVLIRRLAASGQTIRRVAGVILVIAGAVQIYFFLFVFDGARMLFG
ncbi:MAG: cytochrome c biogenesis CcdA family protein [Salinirussus sp.]